jgi:hypothetical protein
MLNLNKIIMVVLGCQNSEIQKDRVTSAINFSNNINSPIWFLTGGTKNTLNQNCESLQMKEYINNYTDSSNIILDEKSQNTAENFVNLKKWIKLNNFIGDIVITTSQFHKERSELIFNKIFKDIIPIWNLAQQACSNCWNNEKYFIKNIDDDIEIALRLFL